MNCRTKKTSNFLWANLKHYKEAESSNKYFVLTKYHTNSLEWKAQIVLLKFFDQRTYKTAKILPVYVS